MKKTEETKKEFVEYSTQNYKKVCNKLKGLLVCFGNQAYRQKQSMLFRQSSVHV